MHRTMVSTGYSFVEVARGTLDECVAAAKSANGGVDQIVNVETEVDIEGERHWVSVDQYRIVPGSTVPNVRTEFGWLWSQSVMAA